MLSRQREAALAVLLHDLKLVLQIDVKRAVLLRQQLVNALPADQRLYKLE